MDFFVTGGPGRPAPLTRTVEPAARSGWSNDYPRRGRDMNRYDENSSAISSRGADLTVPDLEAKFERF